MKEQGTLYSTLRAAFGDRRSISGAGKLSFEMICDFLLVRSTLLLRLQIVSRFIGTNSSILLNCNSINYL
jgi:hypothetical protein